MRAVLGVDAAWTAANPSGVALVCENTSGWTLAAVAPSVDEFLAISANCQHDLPVAHQLVRASKSLAGVEPVVVAVDMPMASNSIFGRRASDDAVSRAYGSRKCATHTPSATRPGLLGERWTNEFRQAGFPLRTAMFEGRGLVEVYPHPALVELAGAQERLPYKVSRVRAYWPEASAAERRGRLLATWQSIIGLLDNVVTGSRESLDPLIVSGRLKAAEDAIDAVVCAWVGCCVLEGRATPFGDELSAIWIPKACQALVSQTVARCDS